IVKVALLIKHRELVPNLNFNTPNPRIPFDELHLKVQQNVEPWPAGEASVVGINSFGFGGTNAHVGSDQAPVDLATQPHTSTSSPKAKERSYLLPLSARSPDDLQAQARSIADFVQTEDAPSMPDLVTTAALHRTQNDYRLALTTRDRQDLVEQLEAFS